jgi:hypothetical protein
MRPYPAPAFENSRIAFEAIVKGLSSEEAGGLDHAAVERRVRAEGQELMRCMVQDYLDLRAERENVNPPASVLGADGKERTEARPSSRPLGTLFGSVVVRRRAMVRHGVSGSLHPLDARLNLPLGKYSFGVQREIAWNVAQSSYETSVENVHRTTGTTIAKRQAEKLVVRFAADFEDFYLEQERTIESAEDLLVLTFDGSGVVMRPEGLRPDTRKMAERARRKAVAETASELHRPVDDANRKRMAEVAAVYSLEVSSRTPDDVVRELRRTGPHTARPKAKNKRVWASLERPILSVIDDAFTEAMLRDEPFERRWIALVDGNANQIGSIRRVARDCGAAVTIVVDFIHVLGYLWKAGKALNGDVPSEEIEAWVNERAERVLYGEACLVAAGIRRSATCRSLRGNARKIVDKCANYLLNHREYLRYDEYLRDGLPIATGVIEGACRSLVQDRMDITGARWGLEGAEAVLKLRSLRASGDFDAYASLHERRELVRNHLDHYDQQELIELREAA